MEELKLAIGEIRNCVMEKRSTDSMPKRTEIIDYHQKN